MLISPFELLRDAKKNNYAIAAFNFYNLDTLMAVLDAANEENAPVIAQVYSEHFVHYNGGGMLAAAALQAINEYQIPVALHLDHASNLDHIRAAIVFGFTSVMYDGSAEPLAINIRNTAQIVKEAHAKGIYTEAELGRIGRINENSTVDMLDDYAGVEESRQLVSVSRVDSFAPAIGTAHGVYRSDPKINFVRLLEIREATGVPLVLHGGSGIPDDMIKKSISMGICKINVGTELKHKWANTIKAGLETGVREPIALSALARNAVKEVARQKIRLFGSNAKA